MLRSSEKIRFKQSVQSFFPVLFIFLVTIWRFGLAAITQFAATLIAYRQDFAFTSIWGYGSLPELHWLQSWPALWSIFNFDGVQYALIAGNGYVDQARFLPVWPGLLRLVNLAVEPSTTFSNAQLLSGIVLAQLCFILMLWMLWKLVRLDATLTQTIWIGVALLVFPVSFFLVQFYSESFFLLAALISFWAARHQKWSWAAVAAGAAMLTRLTGIILLPALLVEFWLAKPTKLSPLLYLSKSWKKILLVASSPVGLVAYSYFNYIKWGDWLYFVHAHSLLNNGRSSSALVFPLQTVYRYYQILISVSPQLYEWWLSAFELSVFVFGCVALLTLWAQYRTNRLSYLVYATLGFLIPVLSGTFSGLPRYLLILFPIFILIGTQKSAWVRGIYLAVCIPLLILGMALFSRGYFVA